MLLRPAAARKGLTLLEVILSLAIFLMGFVVIGQLISASSERAIEVQTRTHALQIAQSKMAEVQAGAVPLQTADDQPCEEDDKFHWSLHAEQGSVQGLWSVVVRVTRHRSDGHVTEVSLARYLLDPTMRGSTQDVPGPVVSSTTATQAGTTGSSSSSSSTTTPAASGR